MADGGELAADVPRSNWSGNLRYSTDRVYAPRTVEEVQAIVRQESRLKALGSRHCFNDIADSRFAQISMLGLDSIDVDAEASRVTVGAGISYGKLAPVLDARGFALSNLASLPHITVAGSIGTATHGSGVRNGCLATQVSGLELVTADGDVLQLTKADDGDDFLAAVVHLGALGVVTAVTLDLLPAFEMTQTVYENLSFDRLEHGFDDVMGAGYSVSLFTDWQGHRATQVWIKERVEPGTAGRAYGDMAKEFHGATLQTRKLHPLAGMSAENCTEQMGSVGRWYERLPHFKMEFMPSGGEEIQSEYFVPREQAYAAVLAVEELRDRITPHLLASELRSVAADRLPLSMAFERDSLAIHFTWRRNEAAVRAVLPAIEASLAPFTPRPHWGKVFTMEAATLRGAYPRLETFRAMAAKLDPEGKFRNGYLEQHLYGR